MGCFFFQQYGAEYHAETFDSVSAMLETYYAKKNTLSRIHQKSADLRRIVQTALERNRKKLILQEKQMKDTAKKDKYKIYGELINTYGYGLEDGCKSFKAVNYYNNEEVTIPLDPTMTPAENSKKYFDKYGKLKRTEEALKEQLEETRSEIDHLESISNALDIALAESDLAQIKEELAECGYIKKHYDRKKGQKMQAKSRPFHYVTEDGYDIYVGKNNFQNDELTFKFATGNDWWFHAKKMAGSHVVVKSRDGELPDHIFEIAGQLAAYYSKGRTAPKVEIDYIQKKAGKKTGRCQAWLCGLLYQLFSDGRALPGRSQGSLRFTDFSVSNKKIPSCTIFQYRMVFFYLTALLFKICIYLNFSASASISCIISSRSLTGTLSVRFT